MNAPTREWIETRWGWLTEQFGSDLMVSAPTILPTPDFFPDEYDRTEAAGRRLLERVCAYMDVNRETVELKFFSNDRRFRLVNEEGHAIGDAAGTYHRDDSKFVIRLDKSHSSSRCCWSAPSRTSWRTCGCWARIA